MLHGHALIIRRMYKICGMNSGGWIYWAEQVIEKRY